MNICQKHQRQTELFCLEDECKGDRLACYSCFYFDSKHHSHKAFLIQEFIEGRQDLFIELFGEFLGDKVNQNEKISDMIKQKISLKMQNQVDKFIQPIQETINKISKKIKKELDEYCQNNDFDNIQNIRQLQLNMEELISSNSQQLQDQLKQQFDQYNENSEIRKACQVLQKKIEEIQNQTTIHVAQVQNLMKEQEKEMKIIINQINEYQTIEQKIELRNSAEKVTLKNVDELDDYQYQILDYESNKIQFQIWLSFVSINSHFIRKNVIKWVDNQQLWKNINLFWIRLQEDSKAETIEILDQIRLKSKNIYEICIQDKNFAVDQDIHSKLMEIVQKQELLRFEICFSNNLNEMSKQKLIKKYSKIMKDQQSLDSFGYQITFLDSIESKRTIENKDETIALVEQISKSDFLY